MSRDAIRVTGAGVSAAAALELPGVPEALVSRGSDDISLAAHIKRRGVRYKDKATRMALVSARRAMEAAGVASGYEYLNDPKFAVLVSCRFGNVDTVLRCAAQIRESGARSLSPMELPNASANVVSATLAIWFGLRGPNLLVAGGRDIGLQALRNASILLRSRQADRVLVCGVDVKQPDLAPLFDRSAEPPLVDVAASIVLENVPAEASSHWSISSSRGGTSPPFLTAHPPEPDLASVDLHQSEVRGHLGLGAHGAGSILALIAIMGRELELSDARRGFAMMPQ